MEDVVEYHLVEDVEYHIDSTALERIQEVEQYFDSGNEITADGLRAFLDGRPRLEAVDAAIYLHCACAHPRAAATAGVIDFLLAAFPGAVRTPAAWGSWLAPAEEELGQLVDGVVSPLPLHLACANPHCPTAVLFALLERHPVAISTVCKGRWVELRSILTMLVRGYDHYSPEFSAANRGLPLHYYVSRNARVELDVVERLVAVHPAALADKVPDYTPLEMLLLNRNVDDFVDTVQFLLARTDEQGVAFLIPLLHLACANNHVSRRIVSLLVARAPGSVDEEAAYQWGPFGLPVHFLLTDTSTVEDRGPEMLASLEHLLEASPASLRRQIYVRSLPIHTAASSWRDPGFVKAILRRDPASASIKDGDQRLPLHLAAMKLPDATSRDVLRCLFDVHPEGIWDTDAGGHTPSQLARGAGHLRSAEFLNRILRYANVSKNPVALTTSDENGQLPLHHALCDGAFPGVIQLFAKANPAALEHRDAFRDYPLHHACRMSREYCTFSLDIVKLLVNGHPGALSQHGFSGDYPLHHACRARHCAVIKFLLGCKGAMASERNGERKFPLELLCQFGTQNQHPEAVETIWRLLCAYPEILLRFRL